MLRVSNQVTMLKNAVTASPVTFARGDTPPLSMMRITRYAKGDKVKTQQ